jgi:sulfite reductase (ferredoxin)
MLIQVFLTDEPFDVLPYAVALTDKLTAESDSWLLPRKFKISFSSSDRDNAYAAFNDLGFIAKIRTENGVSKSISEDHLESGQ